MKQQPGNYTSPADYYIAPPTEIVAAELARNNLGEGTDLETAIAALHAASHTRDGKNSEEAFLSPDKVQDVNRLNTLKDIVNAVNFDELTGDSPLEKAMSFAAAIRSEGGVEQMQNAMHNGTLGRKIASMQQKIQAAKEMAAGNGPKGSVSTSMLNIDPNKPELSVAKLTRSQADVLKALALISQIGEIQSKKKSKPRLDIAGRKQRSRLMMDYEELPEAENLSDYVLPTGRLQLVNMEFYIPEYFSVDRVRQSIALLIDGSGSMSWGYNEWKQSFVRAGLLFYMDKVARGECDLFVSLFESKILGFERLQTKEQCEAYYKAYECPNLGMTEVGDCIVDAQRQIEALKIGKFPIHIESKPELVVINDGQDKITTIETVAPVHAISLEVDNPDLRALAEGSGGSFNLFSGQKINEEYRW